jgi:hypothetical protein
MPYQEKRAVVNIALECAMFAAYCAYAWNRFAAIGIAADDLKSWDLMTLAFIGIGVAAAVVTRIFFHILLSMGIAVNALADPGRAGRLSKPISRRRDTNY